MFIDGLNQGPVGHVCLCFVWEGVYRNALSCLLGVSAFGSQAVFTVPWTLDDRSMVTTFSVAAKGSGRTFAVAGAQASYDGTSGARGVLGLWSYGKP